MRQDKRPSQYGLGVLMFTCLFGCRRQRGPVDAEAIFEKGAKGRQRLIHAACVHLHDGVIRMAAFDDVKPGPGVAGRRKRRVQGKWKMAVGGIRPLARMLNGLIPGADEAVRTVDGEISTLCL